MATISFDTARCNGCGICVEVCPMRLVRIENGRPKSIENPAGACIGCGQCLAFCPTGAFTLGDVRGGDCPPALGPDEIDSETFGRFLQGRRSIRAFTGRTVERGLVEKALAMAGHAPTGHNMRPVRWLVALDPARLKAIGEAVIEWMRGECARATPLASILNCPALVAAWDKGHDPVFRGAPHLVLAWYPGPKEMTMDSGAIAVTQLELAFAALGLGATWAGFVMIAGAASPAVREACGLNATDSILAGLFFGYPKYRPVKIPPRAPLETKWV